MGAYARVGDADVMPGLRPEPLWPWYGRQGRRRQPTGADRARDADNLFSGSSAFGTTRNGCRLLEGSWDVARMAGFCNCITPPGPAQRDRSDPTLGRLTGQHTCLKRACP